MTSQCTSGLGQFRELASRVHDSDFDTSLPDLLSICRSPRRRDSTGAAITQRPEDHSVQVDRLLSHGGTAYAYDGDGYRVGKTVNGVTTTYAWERLSAGGLGTVVGRRAPGHCQGTRANLEHSPSGARGRYAATSTGSTG